MAPTATARRSTSPATATGCGRLVGGVALRHRERRQVLRRARGERGEEQTAERERSACAPEEVRLLRAGRTQRCPLSMVVPEATPGGLLRGQHPTPETTAAGGSGQGLREQVEVQPAEPAPRHPATPGARSPTARRADASGRPRGGARRARRGPPSTRPARGGTSTRRRTSRRPTTPYRPPASRSSPSGPTDQASTLCTQPRSCSRAVRRRDVLADPAARAAAGRRSTRTTSSYAVSTRISKRRQAAPQRPAHPQPVERQHAARVGRPPADRAAPRDAASGTDAAAVGREHGARLQVGADGRQLLPRRRRRRRRRTRSATGAARPARAAPERRLRGAEPAQGRGQRTCGATSATASGPYASLEPLEEPAPGPARTPGCPWSR